ncbi:hypothetical protein M0812_19784 [Anaeramoeba flamelloides]|uniref:Uncharacterized protein n=1 Tax=Anaeramoeba flamelloides TaxID=1746091 RepID=A0AAV7Z2F8_9EUKA|nr:hypothetical protein M0812_19784 [Anaeramoeba flamelloides]
MIKAKEKTKKIRSKTINQKRLEELLGMGKNYVSGLNKGSLKWPNCPKSIQINSSLLRRYKLTKYDLNYFILRKFNLTNSSCDNPYDLDQSCDVQGDKEWINFHFQKNYQVGEQIENYLFTKEYSKKYQKMGFAMKKAFQKCPKMFRGIENALFLEPDYQLPSQVIIQKVALKKLCTKLNSGKNDMNTPKKNNQKGELGAKIKKIHRGLSFFFVARFNLKNATAMKRDVLRFARRKIKCNKTRQTQLLKQKGSRKRRKPKIIQKSNLKTIARQNDRFPEEMTDEEPVHHHKRKYIKLKNHQNENVNNNEITNFSEKSEQELTEELINLLVSLKHYGQN